MFSTHPSSGQRGGSRPDRPFSGSSHRHSRDEDFHVHSIRPDRDEYQPQASAATAAVAAETLLRVVSACLASAAVSTSAVTQLLVRATSPPASVSGSSSRLDSDLSWVIGAPVGAIATAWQLGRLLLLLLASRGSNDHHRRRPVLLLMADVLMEMLLGVGAAVCAVLAGFQASRHQSFNRKHGGAASPRARYRDVGPDIALTVLLGLLMLSSFGVLCLALAEANRRRRSCGSSSSSRSRRDSSSSSVIEIIPR